MTVSFNEIGVHLLQSGPYVLGIILLPIVYSLLFRALERPFHNEAELAAFDATNDASGINRFGAYMGLAVAVGLGPLLGSKDTDYLSGLASFYASGLITIVSFIVFHHVLDKVVLRNINNAGEIRNGNVAAALTEAAAYVALGLVISGSFAGGGQPFGEGILSALLFTVLGTITLMLVYALYTLSWKRFRGIDVDRKIYERDLASGIDAGAVLIAIAVTLFFSIAGDFTGWLDDLVMFCIAVLSSTTLVLVGRFLAGKLLAATVKRGSDLNRSLELGAVTIGIGLVAGLLI